MMRVTESELRGMIRRAMLAEAARGPGELGDDVYVLCRQSPGIGGSVTIRPRARRGRPSASGMVTWHDPGPERPNYVETASADSGWGPMLYDIAIELSGPKGLMPDRWEVSQEARRVWKHYLLQRPDIEAVQYDNRQNELTPDPRDNVDQHSAEEDPEAAAWHESPLSKAYRKRGGGTPTVDALESMGKIVMETYEDDEV